VTTIRLVVQATVAAIATSWGVSSIGPKAASKALASVTYGRSNCSTTSRASFSSG
jgi:hypothetical protein